MGPPHFFCIYSAVYTHHNENHQHPLGCLAQLCLVRITIPMSLQRNVVLASWFYSKFKTGLNWWGERLNRPPRVVIRCARCLYEALSLLLDTPPEKTLGQQAKEGYGETVDSARG